ncbi:MAG: FISUMP domain-containing protein [Prolixibacteraceae bacterium]|nr:FISUMP domain-containing protein [Prolixibacteraceae bacterium]
MKPIQLFLQIFVGLILYSCTNQPPTCTIISPSNGDEFTQGEKITFVINATDEDGSVASIELLAGSELIKTLTQMPFIYEWDTKDFEAGSYTITATAVDDEGEGASASVTLDILQKLEVPTVETLEASAITEYSATLNGAISLDGNSAVTKCGFYWSSSDNTPDSGDNVEEVSGTGENITFELSDLTPSSKYYYTAFAINAEGTSTGEVKSFTTQEAPITKPELETLAVTNITSASAVLNAEVVFDGGATIKQRGFYWSKTDATPDSVDNVEIVTGTIGSFTFELSNLASNTTYYVAAFATNSEGTNISAVISFTTSEETGNNTITDSRDGHQYKIVKIDNKTWMAENLAYLPAVFPLDESSSTASIYYVYDYNGYDVNTAKEVSNYNEYGVLYNWPAAKNACPAGWHLPTDAEWYELGLYISLKLGPYTESYSDEGAWLKAGKHLMSKSGWSDGNNGYDDLGFSGLPAGFRTSNGMFYGKYMMTSWWSSTQSTSDYHYSWAVDISFDMTRLKSHWLWGLSVRCVKDNQ